MPELRNSQRVTYKATHVAIVPNTRAQPSPGSSTTSDQRTLAKMNRAVPKAAFVRALRIHPTELPLLRKALAGTRKRGMPDAKTAGRALRAISDLVSDPSPMAVFQHAEKFTEMAPSTLVAVGNALVSSRTEQASRVQGAVEQVRASYAAHLDNLKQPLRTGSARRRPVRPLASASAESASNAEGEAMPTRPAAPASFSGRLATSASGPTAQPPEISLSAALQWASSTKNVAFKQLHDLAVTRSPLAASLSNLDRAALAATAVVDLVQLPTQTAAVVQAFNQSLPIEPVGRLHLERIEMTPVGIQRGELVHSVPLTPGETVNISHREWSQTSEGFENIVQEQFEGYSEKGVAEKTDISEASSSESKHSTALNVGVSLSASYASVTLSSSFGYNSASDNSQSEKDSRAHSSLVTSKASARTRKDHKTSFKVSSVAGTEDLAVRTLTNTSDKAMRVDYYQMMRKWKVDLIRYGLRMTYDIVIPSPGIELMEKIDLLRSLDEQIDTPFAFSLSPDVITRDNYATLAAQWDAAVPPPLQYPKQITLTAPIQKNDDDAHTFGSIDFDVDEQYEIETASLFADWSAHKDDDKFVFDVLQDSSAPSTKDNWVLYQSDLNQLVGKSGKLSVVYLYRHIDSGEISSTFNLKPLDSVMTAWRLGAWNAMREAALTQYQSSRQVLKERRTKVAAEIDQFDGLTLRQMEREEIMKAVLRWLFGPTFQLVPFNITSLFGPVPDDPMASWLDPSSWQFQGNSNWQSVMQFGEFIKYIHNAIEWENVLYINYPYFWDTPVNWPLKKFLYHPDPLHRMFLRSGAARVVLTIRPGFEEGFAALMETGAFGTVPTNHPYVTIAQEIQNFAKTNYPGIPPANPEQNVRPQLYLEQRRVWKEMQYLMQLLDAYYADPAHPQVYPTTAQGLAALAPYRVQVNADNQTWNTQNPAAIAENPDLARPTYAAVPLTDFWGNAYVYACPGTTGDYDLISYGADGKEGGSEKDADISANAEGSLVATWFEYTPTSALDVAVNKNLPPTQPDEMA